MIIGILDSGIGGTSILQGLQQALPNHTYLYQSDEKNFPYSTKNEAELKKIAVENVERLLSQGVEMIVVACNTLTVSSIAHLRQTFPKISFVGTVPAIKKAADTLSPTSTVIVLSTVHTANSSYLHKMIEEYSKGQEFIVIGTTDLVTAIETNDYTWTIEVLKQLLEERSKKINIDAIVIGCTHFSLVENEIRSVIPYTVQIFDSIAGITKQVKRLTASS